MSFTALMVSMCLSCEPYVLPTLTLPLGQPAWWVP
jgi:hypothetical protein